VVLQYHRRFVAKRVSQRLGLVLAQHRTLFLEINALVVEPRARLSDTGKVLPDATQRGDMLGMSVDDAIDFRPLFVDAGMNMQGRIHCDLFAARDVELKVAFMDMIGRNLAEAVIVDVEEHRAARRHSHGHVRAHTAGLA